MAEDRTPPAARVDVESLMSILRARGIAFDKSLAHVAAVERVCTAGKSIENLHAMRRAQADAASAWSQVADLARAARG
jgi:hypothetical protein